MEILLFLPCRWATEAQKIPNARLFSVPWFEFPAWPALNLIFLAYLTFLYHLCLPVMPPIVFTFCCKYCAHLQSSLQASYWYCQLYVHLRWSDQLWISFLCQTTTNGILAPHWTCELYLRCVNIINLLYLKLVNHKMEMWLAATCEKPNSWPMAWSFIKLSDKSIDRIFFLQFSIWIVLCTFLFCTK